ncbi:hypothetical protein HanRHA438_Chr00c01g0842851 [Helianthus annuus]|nr:hypothetical protein HanRHA438_Chr00c01g0842851 [Helianthus annuus]
MSLFVVLFFSVFSLARLVCEVTEFTIFITLKLALVPVSSIYISSQSSSSSKRTSSTMILIATSFSMMPIPGMIV